MCGIVGAVAQRNVTTILLEGLKRLEYRGYDSAGIVVYCEDKGLQLVRTVGKIKALADELHKNPIHGNIGIAHTRWATHGEPAKKNAHPHISENNIAVVHNGIIENHQELRAKLLAEGYKFHSDTDTEVIAHLIHKYCKAGHDFLTAVHKTVKQLHGAYALGIMKCDEPDKIIAARCGSPLVVGVGLEENFIASDALALSPVTHNIIYLHEGDIAEVTRDQVTVYDVACKKVKRQIKVSEFTHDAADRGDFRHFMQKEIFEQPTAITETLAEFFAKTIGQKEILNENLASLFGNHANKILNKIKQVQIVACGSSYHAGMAARYWLEDIAQIPCKVEIASEIRYRKVAIEPDTLFVTISQSGETADTLAALRQAKKLPYAATLAICNVPESSLTRESDLVFMTRAGVEIGVATTKAFTAQLIALLLLTFTLGKHNNLKTETIHKYIEQLKHLPVLVEEALKLDELTNKIAEKFIHKQHAFFLGRGVNFPIALEGALKIKELSYLHAESYPAGELKHGPLALIDKEMPVVVIAPNDDLAEKLKSNLHEVRARGGELIVFADEALHLKNEPGITAIKMPKILKEFANILAPIVYTIPMQLLAYHVAVLKGTDVDQPRNLAKSVTVE